VGVFYKPSSYKNFKKFLSKKKFSIRQDGPHMVATHPSDEEIELSVPRSTTISNGVTEKLCKKLVELGFDEQEVKRAILR
jgi:hypothetical protein